MGGNSRSNKKRSRTNRKNSKNSNIVTTSTIVVNEMMVNVPSSSSNSDITEHKNDIKKCESNNSIKSDTDNDEIQTICENKLFECVQTNYRVESPNEVAIKPTAKASNGIVKSRSLDNDDDLKITELSSEASEGEDKTMTECNAVVSETESDVEWEVTEDISNLNENNNNFQSTASIAPENQLETVEVTLITAEEERSLRSFLDGLKLVSSPEEALSQIQKRESYKERKARKRAAIAEHFIPILEQPRYLEVICEESNDTSDSNSSSRTLKNESLNEESNMEGSWKTSLAESSNLKAEIVYIDDSSNSGTESDNSDTEEYEENEDADAEESRSENVSQNSSHQDISKNLMEVSSSTSVTDNSSQKFLEVAIPASQLTPPPTPDLLTPKNETVYLENELNETENDKLNTNILQEEVQNEINSELAKESDVVSSPYEDEFNKEFHGFCDDLNVQYPCKYLNAVSPLAISRSSSVSSEGSSRTQSQRTVRLNSTCSSIADVADLLKDYEYAKDTHKISTPKTLKEMCLNKVISLPFGSDVLEELADVSKSMENLTVLLESKISPRLSNLSHQFSTKKQSAVIKKNVNDINFNVPVMKEDIDRESYTKWVSLPSEQDPGVLMCLSPTQKLHLETTKREFDEAGKLLQLHEKFINRRGYNEGTRNNRKMPENVEITVLSNDSEANNASKASKFSNRLLAIIRESSDAQPISYLNVNNENVIHTREPYLSKSLENLHAESNMESRLINTTIDKENLSEHYENVIKGSTHQTKKNNLFNTETSGSYQSEPASYDSRRVQNSSGNTASFANIPNRRFSLPQEFYQRQMHYIREKEKEIRNEIEELEKEKQKMMQEMDEETPFKYFEADKYCISRKGDIAIHNDEIRSQKIESQKQSLTLPAAPTEFFRQQMYDEYMLKIAARQERKSQKVIKITSSPSSQVGESTNSNNMCEVVHISGIEDEFMNKVNERMRKFGLKRDNSDEVKIDDGSADENEEPILVIDGDSLKEVKVLPKHLQEFLDLTRQVADTSNDDIKEEGIWSPGQKSIEDKYRETIKLSEVQKSDDETIIPVWTPRSAGSSPTLERKEFRPVNFESPTLKRKNIPKSEVVAETPDSPSAHPPWQVPESSGKVGVSLSSSLERRLPTSHSAPASGFTEFSASRLPKAQNPTITLLQKAREGQLPRGASYLHTEHSHRTLGDKPPHAGPGEILYQVRREYTSKSDNEIPRRMADLGSRKYEVGIGPTTKDGMPLVLRSEVKDGNQSRWYKRMYETIHKQKPDPRYPYLSGYFSEPEQSAFSADYYDSDGAVSDSKYATLDRRRLQETINGKENEYISCTLPKSVNVTRRQTEDAYRNQPGRIENYIPGHSSISEKEAKEHLEQQKNIPQPRGHMSKALKESGYESDSTLLFRKREEATQHLSPLEQKEAYKTIQKGGDVPLHGLRKLAPERPKESPRKYVEKEVTIHYKSPIRQEVKESLSEEELSRRQAEHMKRVYEEERRRKYLQVSDSLNELQDMNNRRHTDNFIPSQKSPIPLNRYDDFPVEDIPSIKSQPRSPDFRLVAKALYNFIGQSARELTFRKGDVIYIRRQVDKNWYEGEHNAAIGLFPANYVEIVPYDGIKSTPRKPHEGQARAKFNFIAQTHLELSLAKGELVAITRRVDDNWFEGRIGTRKGIFPLNYVEVLIDPMAPPPPPSANHKPAASPAAHSILLNGSAGGKESMGSHSYTPIIHQHNFMSSYRAKPSHPAGTNYGSLTKSLNNSKNPINEILHIDTNSESIPYRALYKYRPQNDDELELMEGDLVFVLEKCDDGWYVGSSQRTGAFGTFPGNYVERA